MIITAVNRKNRLHRMPLESALEDLTVSLPTWRECEPNGRLLLAALDWQSVRYR